MGIWADMEVSEKRTQYSADYPRYLAEVAVQTIEKHGLLQITFN